MGSVIQLSLNFLSGQVSIGLGSPHTQMRHIGLEIKSVFIANFTDLGPITRYLNVHVTYVKGEYFELDQEAYCLDKTCGFIIKMFGGPLAWGLQLLLRRCRQNINLTIM